VELGQAQEKAFYDTKAHVLSEPCTRPHGAKTTLCVGEVRCSCVGERKQAKTMASLRKKIQDFHKGKMSK